MAKDDILKEALEAFQECESREAKNRADAKEDIRFSRLGEQWPEKIRKAREAEGRPVLTINRMPAFIRQVVNDSRQNKPSIKVHPVEGGDAKTAEVMNGLIRNIEVISNADIAYDTGVEASVGMGLGYWRVNLDYACDDTFDKDVVIRAVPNPFAVYGDPYSQCADSSDWMVAFVIDEMKEAQFARKFSKAKKVDFSADAWRGASGWADGERKIVRVGEYWKREETTKTLVGFTHDAAADVTLMLEDELKAKVAEGAFQGVEIVGSRPTKSYTVKQYRLNGVEVLDSTDWPGRYIPIVPVYGDEVNVEGERHFRSLIRDAKDPARMFNYWRTMGTELVALAPKAPFIGKKGAFDHDIDRWLTANTQTHPFLEYDGTEMPQRQPFAGIPAGAIQEALNASDDMKAVMGLHDASLGARSNETSGRAILARQKEGDVSTFHFLDNLTRAIRHTGKIVLDLIPKVYNSERVLRIIGEDGKPETVSIVGGDTPSQPEANIYNLTTGKYDLTVKAGPSFSTQREEAVAMLTELVRAHPDAAAVLGDIIVENMDIPGGDRVAKRLQALLPPAVKAAEEGQSPEAQMAQQQVQQVTQEAQQIVQQLQGELAMAQNDTALEMEKIALEREKLDVERMKINADVVKAEAQARSAVASGRPTAGATY
jgi:hypothetical protein